MQKYTVKCIKNIFDERECEIKIFQCNNLQEKRKENWIVSYCLSGPDVVNNTKTI